MSDTIVRGTYWISQQQSALSRVRRMAGKTMQDAHNPRLTKRELIAIADYLVELEAAGKKVVNEYNKLYGCGEEGWASRF